MFKKSFTLVLCALTLNLAFGATVFAQNKEADKAVQRAEKLKVQVAKLGTGKDSKLRVKLGNGSTISGYVSQINDDSFVLVSDQSGAATEIQYADAKKISTPRKGLPKAVKIGLGVAIGFGAILGLGILACSTGNCD